MRILTRAIKAALWLLLALCATVIVGALTLRYIVFPHLDIGRAPAERALSRLVHAQVDIRALHAQWRGLQPCVAMDALTLRDQQGRLILEVPHFEATLSWRTLSKFKLIFSDIHIDAPHAVMYKTADGGLMVGNFLVPASTLSDFLSSSSSSAPPLALLEEGLSNLRWLFRQEAFKINNGHVEVQEPLSSWKINHDAARLPSDIKAIQFAIFNQGHHHQVGMQAHIAGAELASLVDMRLHFQHSFWAKATNPAGWVGNGYMRAEAIPLEQLNALLPIPVHLTGGTLTAHNWFTFKHGRIRNMNGVLNVLGTHLDISSNAQKNLSSLPSEVLQNRVLPGIEIPHLSLGYSASYRPALLEMQHPSQSYTGLFTAQIRDVVIELGSPSERQRFESAWMKLAYQMPDRQKSGRFTIAGDTLNLDFISTLIRPFSAASGFKWEAVIPASLLKGQSLPAMPQASSKPSIEMCGVLRNYLLDMTYPWPSAPKKHVAMTFLPKPFGRTAQKYYRLKADFDRLTLLSHVGAPIGVTHFSGSIDANEQGGSLLLNTRDGSLSMPQGLSKPTMLFDVLKGRVKWDLTPVQTGYLLKLAAAPLIFSNQDGAGEINATYQKQVKVPTELANMMGQAPVRQASTSHRYPPLFTLENQDELPLKNIGHFSHNEKVANKKTVYKTTSGKGVLNLSLRLDHALIAQVPHYLPSSLDKGLRDYLKHALQGGVTKHATLEIYGALEDFPFGPSNPAGIFRIRAPFYDGRFDPSAPSTKSDFSAAQRAVCAKADQSANTCVIQSPMTVSAENNTNWPVLEGLEGVFEIDRDALKFSVAQGRYQDVKITQAQGKIAHLSNTEDLLIEIHASGPLNTMLDYVKHSPIPTWTGHVSDWFAATGPAQLALHLQLPRLGTKQIGVEGALTFSGNTITTHISEPGVKPSRGSKPTPGYTLPELTQLQGVLAFTDHSLTLQSATAQWLKGGIEGEVSVYPDGSTHLHAKGHALGAALRAWLHDTKVCKGVCVQLMERLGVKGSSGIPYQFDLNFSRQGSATGELQADLTKLAFDWPAPFAKVKHRSMQLRVSLDQYDKLAKNSGSGLPDKRIDIEFGPLLAAYRVRSVSSRNAYNVVSGALRLDTTAAAQTAAKVVSFGLASTPEKVLFRNNWQTLKLPEKGVVATLETDQLDIDAWHAVLASLSKAGAAKSSDAAGSAPWMSYRPTKIHARVGTVSAAQRVWHAVSLDAAYRHGIWQAAVTAKEFAGQLAWTPRTDSVRLNLPADRPDTGALRAQFLRFTLPPVEDEEAVVAHPVVHSDLPIKDWPALDLQVDDLTLEGKPLGRVAIVAHSDTKRNQSKWWLEKLQITNPDATLCVKGEWVDHVLQAANSPGKNLKNGESGRSAFNFELTIQHAGALLERLGIPKMLQGGVGSAQGQIQWRGGPERLSYDSLTGYLKLDLNHGRLLKAEPGVGNLLGALSLQSLAHLLVLDFRYLPGRGLAFDYAKGSAVIQNGVAYIDDFSVSSTPAHITLAGSANLADRQQTLLLTIQPAINAGSAVLAATVLNPVLGLGSYIAQQVLSASLSHNFLQHYTVSGSWENPVIERVQTDKLAQNLSENSKEDSKHHEK